VGKLNTIIINGRRIIENGEYKHVLMRADITQKIHTTVDTDWIISMTAAETSASTELLRGLGTETLRAEAKIAAIWAHTRKA
jgi:hypothetical protein